MKVTGIGPKIAAPSFLYLAIVIIVHLLSGTMFRYTEFLTPVAAALGAALILAGVFVIGFCGRQIIKSFNTNILMTDGLFRVCRNPMYAAYVVFIIPGLSLLINSWLVLTTAVIFIIALNIFIKEEYNFLAAKYGAEYETYLKKVWVKFI